MSDVEQGSSSGRFMGWRDLTLTPAVELALLAGAIVPALWLRARYGFGGLGTALLAYAFLVAETVAFLRVLRGLFPRYFVPGVFSAKKEPWRAYVALNLYGFLLITNLTFQTNTVLVPPPLRALFYALMGARVGRGIVPIGGKLLDPHLTELGAGAMIGEEAMVLGHGLNTVGGDDVVVLGKVVIGAGAIVGARAMVMPGVTIGEHSMVAAMSFVPMGTKIPPYETWGGWPAKKLSSRRPRPVEAPAAASSPAPATDAA